MIRRLIDFIYEPFIIIARRRFITPLLVPALLVLIGTIGFRFLEGLSLWDALYRSVVTLTTVGYGDIVPQTVAGQMFTMLLVLFGVFAFFHVAFEVIRVDVSMGADSVNLFTTMSARLLNSKVFIVARHEDAQSEQKLLRAGANRVVSPYHIGGMRMAHAIIRPTVVDFIELATNTEHIDLQMEEVRIAEYSPLAKSNLLDSRLRADLKIIIVAIKKAEGTMIFNPTPESKIIAGDTLVAIGHREQLRRLEILANPALKEKP